MADEPDKPDPREKRTGDESFLVVGALFILVALVYLIALYQVGIGMFEPSTPLPIDPCAGESADVCAAEASWANAYATRDLVWWVPLTLIMEAIGGLAAAFAAVFAFRAYRESRRSRIAAEKQANSAEIALEHTEKDRRAAAKRARQEDRRQLRERQETLEREQKLVRAYLDLDEITFVEDMSAREGKTYLGTRLDLKNFGQTPAQDVTVECKHYTTNGQSLFTSSTFIPAIMPGHFENWTTFSLFNVEERDEVTAKSNTFMASFEISYRDVFGDNHRLEAVFQANELGNDCYRLPGGEID